MLLLTYRPESAVVFCNTRQEVRAVAEDLFKCGFSVLALHGDLDQREREEMLVRFANRSCTVLVASDVAARGLDIADLAMVINFDIASDADTHLHRIGRTGRAGRRGIALSLCSPRESTRARVIEDRLGEALTWGKVPTGSRAEPWAAPFVTLAIDAGRQDKLRPGDLLGALTGAAGLPGTAVGKIDCFPLAPTWRSSEPRMSWPCSGCAPARSRDAPSGFERSADDLCLFALLSPPRSWWNTCARVHYKEYEYDKTVNRRGSRGVARVFVCYDSRRGGRATAGRAAAGSRLGRRQCSQAGGPHHGSVSRPGQPAAAGRICLRSGQGSQGRHGARWATRPTSASWG